MRLVAMPADSDTFFIFGAQDLLYGAAPRPGERFDPRDERREPDRDILRLLELARAIVIAPAEGSDPAVAFIGAELERLQRQLADMRDEFLLFLGGNEVCLVAQANRAAERGRKKAQGFSHCLKVLSALSGKPRAS